MKKLFSILIFVLISCSVIGQDVHYTLTNPRNVDAGGASFHIVDVLTYSKSSFKLGSGQLYVNYDTAAFGPNVFANGNVVINIPPGSILDTKVGAPPTEFKFYGDIVLNDNTDSRFSYSWQHDFSNACLFDENVDYYTDILFTMIFKFKDGQSTTDPGICFEGSAVYIDQTFTACGPFDCSTSNCFDFPGQQLVADFYSCESACTIVYATADDGPGSLRNAIDCAQPGDTIVFAPNLAYDSIQLTSEALFVGKDVKIVAKEDLSIFVKGTDVERSFIVWLNSEVYIEGLQITSGSEAQGKGLFNFGELTLNNVTLHAAGPATGNNSTLQNNGVLTIQGVTRILQE